MKEKIVFATGNPGKIREVREMMAETGMEVISMTEAGIPPEALCSVAEDGGSHEENALIKARAAAAWTDAAVLADDSGLEVDFLGKEPGIYSARYLGEDTPYSVKNRSLIDRLRGVEEAERTARFVCAIAAVLPDGRELTVRATVEGRIAYEEKGGGGFGYDPIFFLPEFSRTMAELTKGEKNRISHRGKALRRMKEELQKIG
ncbi:MAG: RdgB/HAM1 family non-canonical purine NTP pyrophosphatase [Clostridium sp.]|nr:RdgB/HAM1 family non-canonical purine NTP pyrophosphatase [Clostridium sp.]